MHSNGKKILLDSAMMEEKGKKEKKTRMNDHTRTLARDVILDIEIRK